MVPNYLSLSNFLSYGDQVPPLDFAQFQVACLTGDNGNGKSALLDAITYALWGEARKSTSERKPDEGLLRLGASEMRVELCFELDDNLFRVIRSFRKGRRTNSSQLELQLFDRDANTFQSISEGSSLSSTQQRINQLLSMDYDTFINSAFIVQGRADEFTQKSARQRKEILAEILGLGRYDLLQERARKHFQEKNKSCQNLQRRLQELDVELAHQEEYQRQLDDLKTQLEEFTVRIAEGDKNLEELREQRLEQTQLQSHLQEIHQERMRLDERRQELGKERDHLHAQQHKDSEILAAASTIQVEFDTYQQLTSQDTQLRQKLERLQELEDACRALETQIVDERHKVEKRCEKWEARQQILQNQLQHSRNLLEQAETIEARYNLFVATRQQEQALEKQRIRDQALQHEQAQLQHQTNLEKQRLTTQQDILRAQVATLQQRLQEKDALESRISDRLQEEQTLHHLVEELEQVKEAGSELRAQLEQRRQQLPELEKVLEIAGEKVRILQDSPQAECPLCGSELDEKHLLQLDQELARQEREQKVQLEHHRRTIQELENQLETKRQHFQQLEQQTHPLKDLQRELADLQARLAQFQEAQQELQHLEKQLEVLDQTIAAGCYAAADQQRLEQIREELEALNYHSEQHAKIRESLQDQAVAEIDFARLRDSREQGEKIHAELAEASSKLELARTYLEDQLYAQTEQQKLRDLRAQIHALDYHAEEHRNIRIRIDELSDAVARRESLILAQQRYTSSQESIKKNEKELESLGRSLQDLDDKHKNLEQRCAGLAGVEQRCEELSAHLSRMRTDRDQLLQRQGSLQALFDRCLEWAKERKQVQEQLSVDQKDSWTYQQLIEAFGKDGIQALIIENAIPDIEKETNAILARLTNNRIQIAIESLRDLKKGGTRETLDIKIADEIGERSYHLYSGGEAFRTNFALRIALAKVLAKRAGTRLRTLIIDEGFGTQDSQGLEQLVEAIQEISKDFDKLLVVTHLPELKNAFPVQIEVTKHPDRGSSFEIIRSA